MNTILINNQIDKKVWNKFISNDIYSRYEWLNIISDTYGLSPYFVMTHQGDKFALIATFNIKNKYISLPYLSFSGFKYNDDKLLCILKNYLKENSITVESKELLKKEVTQGYVNPMVEVVSFDSFWKNISSNTRNQFKKSEKNNFTFKENDTIDNFYSLYTTSMHRLGTPSHKKLYFKNISDKLDTIILSIFDNDKVIGSMFCIYGNSTFYIAYAATLPEYNPKYANYFLYLNAIKWMSNHNLTILDMGRSTYGKGTFGFKKKFKPKFYAIQSSASYTNNTKMNMASSIWKKLPLSLANFIGPKVRKYLV